MRQRRVPRESTERNRWSEDREWHMSRALAGQRPAGWWQYESGRPDLAADAGQDTFVHLRDQFGGAARSEERARERLRQLRDSGELTTAEIADIHRLAATERSPARWGWRSAVLREDR